MKTCATQEKIVERFPAGYLFLPVPDTYFRDFLLEVEELARFAPEIIIAIEKDLDAHAKEKKIIRLADKKYYKNKMASLPGLSIKEQKILAENLNIGIGRPRMPAYLVYVFLMIRGFIGTLTSRQAKMFLLESMTLCGFLLKHKFEMPGITTILENVNMVSNATRDLVHDRQLKLIREEELDDFKETTIDSTSVEANSCWPTDAKILTGLLMRANRLGQKLDIFGLFNFQLGWMPKWLKQMDALEFSINLTAGKANSKGKLKKHYRRLLNRGQKAVAHLAKELEHFEQGAPFKFMPPSRLVLLEKLVSQVKQDIADAYKVIEYSNERIFRGKKLSSTEKILSLSDKAAAYIKKGSRNPVIGYKPQLGRSKNGFVSSLIVPEGNASDSGKLVPILLDSIQHTCVTPWLVSTDDGYASKLGRDTLLAMGIDVVSISGAKGKKLTDKEDWNSEIYRNARRNRSAVESLMFTIKDGFNFGKLGRRGIDAVRAELLEKVLAYNCCRIVLLKKRRRQILENAA
jgi:hypothetical protein